MQFLHAKKTDSFSWPCEPGSTQRNKTRKSARRTVEVIIRTPACLPPPKDSSRTRSECFISRSACSFPSLFVQLTKPLACTSSQEQALGAPRTNEKTRIFCFFPFFCAFSGFTALVSAFSGFTESSPHVLSGAFRPFACFRPFLGWLLELLINLL